ncbi:MAG TPA: DUF4404 family protein [Pirellulales bacterium]|jgi:diadenosine tetraphosphate (Ap4A) HIT family hydrolase|nr:DUF4404 family protein [Pirellulales bacterium]
MSINSLRLKTTLEQLHQQLAEIDALDPAARAELTAALQEIQQALQNKTLPPAKPLMRRLGEAARHFEENHPALAGSIKSLIDTLGRSGI